MKRMKNMSKRLLALFIVLMMCLSMVNVTALAAEDGDTEAETQTSEGTVADESSEVPDGAEDGGQDVDGDVQDTEDGDQDVDSNAQDTEDGDQDADSNVQDTEDGDQDADSNVQDTEDGDQDADSNVQDTEDGDQDADSNDQDTENGDQDADSNDQDTENGDQDADSNSQDTENGGQDVDNNDQDTENGDQDADNNVQDTEDGDKQDTVVPETSEVPAETVKPEEPPVKEVQPEVVKPSVSPEMIAFLAAAAALPAEVTWENAEEVTALVEQCYAAYEALSEDDLADEKVTAALVVMAGLMEQVDTLEAPVIPEGTVVVTTAKELNAALAAATEDTVIDVRADISFEGKYDDVLKVGSAGTIISSTGSTLSVSGNIGIEVGYQKVLTIGDGLILNSKVTVSGSGKFVMNEGSKITSHSVKMNGGTFIMNGGEISGSHDSAVYVAGGTFTMNDGLITGNTDDMYGAGVYVALDTNKWQGTAVFEMNGGTISNNIAEGNSSKGYHDCGGAGVFVKTGSFTMNGGTITGNSATGKNAGGGGVYVGSGQTFTMNGGEISGNSASYGGGVAIGGYARSGGTFTMNGGTVTGNKASTGGGVYVNGRIYVSGGVNITGNTNKMAAPVANEVYLPSGKAIGVLANLAETSLIGVTPEGNGSGTVIATGNVSEEDISKFSLTTTEFELRLTDISGSKAITLYKLSEARYTAPNGTTEEGDFPEMWAKVIAGGTVTLLRDATFPRTGATLWPVEQDKNKVTLDLNGHTLNLNGKCIMVGNYVGNKTDGYTYFKGDLTLTDGVGGGVLTGGRGRSNYGGAVYLYYGAFTMDGGTLTGNGATYGGAVYVAKSGTFVMNGGTISGNTASHGGGIYTVGTSTMNGGTIEGHKVGGYGGGIYVGNKTFTMNGGTVQDNTASNGGGIMIQTTAKGYIYGGNILNNTAHCNFESDKDLYPYGGGGIYVNGGKGSADGELYLYNAVITNNDANTGNSEKHNDGAGIVNCPTSNVKVYLSSGGAIYGNGDNTAISQVFVDGRKTEHQVYLSKYMLGGGAYNWTDGEGNALANVGVLQTLTDEKVSAYNTVSSIPDGLAKVVISGNSSALFGGGIGSNGSVIIGNDLGVLELTKTVVGDTDVNEFTFEVTVGAEKQTVTLKAGETKVLSGLPVGAAYSIVETTTGADSTTATVNGITVEAGEDGKVVASGTITKESEGIAKVEFVNTYMPEEPKPETTRLTVTKVWSDGNENHTADSIIVRVYNDGVEVTGSPVTLSAANEWTATISGLPVDGKYSVTEEKVSGYTSNIKLELVDGKYTATITNTKETSKPTTGSLTITKVVVGGGTEARDKTYTFTVTYPDGTVKTVSVKGNASETLEDLEPGTYTVAEVRSGLGVSGYYLASVTGEGAVTVEIGKTAGITVTNTYSPDDDDDDDDPPPPPKPEEPEEPDIPDEDPPRTDIPDEDPPLTDIPEEEPPLVDVPDVEIPEEEIPLDEAPATGDVFPIWGVFTFLSALALIWLIADEKKRKSVD